MGKCLFCGKTSPKISTFLSACYSCIQLNSTEIQSHILKRHEFARKQFNLPFKVPKSFNEDSFTCTLCPWNCSISSEEKGYCGLPRTSEKKPTTKQAYLSYYYDALPTNCCSSWFCPAGTGQGFPRYAYKSDAEYGHHNLAVFFYGCNFNCLFCQNEGHKRIPSHLVTREELINAFFRRKTTSCVCFFGGDPQPHFPFTIAFSRKLTTLAKEKKRICRVCWESNGYGNQKMWQTAWKIAFKSGGNIKFDLKAFSEATHYALTGASNKQVLKNFELLGKLDRNSKRDAGPSLTATTLLVPGYIEVEEIRAITEFIRRVNPDIPYSLLGFHPLLFMSDLPPTTKEQALNCFNAAKEVLTNVNLGNQQLLV